MNAIIITDNIREVNTDNKMEIISEFKSNCPHKITKSHDYETAAMATAIRDIKSYIFFFIKKSSSMNFN